MDIKKVAGMGLKGLILTSCCCVVVSLVKPVTDGLVEGLLESLISKKEEDVY